MTLATRGGLIASGAGAGMAAVAGALLAPSAAYADVAPAPVLAGIAGGFVVAIVVIVAVIVLAVVFILRAIRKRRGVAPAALQPVPPASPVPPAEQPAAPTEQPAAPEGPDEQNSR